MIAKKRVTEPKALLACAENVAFSASSKRICELEACNYALTKEATTLRTIAEKAEK